MLKLCCMLIFGMLYSMIWRMRIYGIVCSGMKFYCYVMRFECNALRCECYAIQHVVKDVFELTVKIT